MAGDETTRRTKKEILKALEEVGKTDLRKGSISM
jgi:hypothetical protein